MCYKFTTHQHMCNERIFTLAPKALKCKFFSKNKFRVKKELQPIKVDLGLKKAQKYWKSHNRAYYLISYSNP